MEPNNAYHYNNLGWAYTSLKDYDKAIFYCNKALELSPNFYLAYHSRGERHKSIGDTESAKADFVKAETLGYNG